MTQSLPKNKNVTEQRFFSIFLLKKLSSRLWFSTLSLSIWMLHGMRPASAWEVQTVFGITISGGDRPLTSLIDQILNILYGLAGASAFLMIVVGAYQYTTAGGDGKKAAAAKETWRSAFTGLILVLTAFLISEFIGSIIGVDDEITNPEV